MDLARILRQTIAWTPATGLNDRGERTFGAAVTVPAWSVSKVRDIIAKGGESVTTARQVTMLVEPAIGDLLGGREVIQVAPMPDYTGTVVGYQALTR